MHAYRKDTVQQPVGRLQVTLSPASAITAGARWRVDGGDWQTSAATVSNLAVGQHTVEFLDVPHWSKPSSRTVEVLDEQTSQTTGIYEPLFVAAFSVSPAGGKAPLKVAFTDKSVGAITSLQWDLGDGRTTRIPNPVHVYRKPGSYAVKLTVTGPDGTSMATGVIDVLGVPRPNFVTSPRTGKRPLLVSFTDKSSGSITSWAWDFGDGSPVSTEQNPKHTFNAAGTFTVRLTTSGPLGSRARTQRIVVTDP